MLKTVNEGCDKNFFNLKLESENGTGNSSGCLDQVRILEENINRIDQELHKQVLENHHDLLRQAYHANNLDKILKTMNLHIQNLYANAERLKTQITVPFEQLKNHTKVLSRLHQASHILRQVNRIQQLNNRLSNTSDPVQKATLLQELEQMAVDPQLSDIDTITSELRSIRLQQQNVIKLATGILNQGIVNENVMHTSTSIQIFFNLGTLKTALETLITQSTGEYRTVLKNALDINLIGGIYKSKESLGRRQLISHQNLKSRIWDELEKCFSEEIYQICKQVKFLQIVLDDLDLKVEDVAAKFWRDAEKILQDEIEECSSTVQQILQEEFSRLLKHYCDMTNKLNYDRFRFDPSIFRKFENSYLSTSLSRLLDPVQSMFGAENNVPSNDDIDSLIRIISSELSIALVEKHLSEQVAKNVGKCLKMFAVKIEHQLETGPESAQVIGGSRNASQQKNLEYANIVNYMLVQAKRLSSNMKTSLSESGAAFIDSSLKNLDVLTEAIIDPLIVSGNSVIETIIISMHLEPGWTKSEVPINKNIPASPYMKELVQFITRIYNIYLVDFHHKEILSKMCEKIALRCIELFVRHSSILRPISEGGRHRLKSDYNHLEEVLKFICPKLSNLGRPYRILKTMASLVTQSPEEIVAGLVSGSPVPHSIILFMLFSFADQDLASPHQNTGWSLIKLSSWLDEHTNELDRLDLIAGALQKYESLIRLKNSTNYDPVYPVMSQLLEYAIKELTC